MKQNRLYRVEMNVCETLAKVANKIPGWLFGAVSAAVIFAEIIYY